ncbi:MAG: hypothetical protein IJV48_08410 [Ruminococcus sp.]|nr:hypothetical protein [Ruminococcus sp.]
MNTYSTNSNHPANNSEIDSRNNTVPSKLRESAEKKGLASLKIGIVLLFFLTFGQILLYLPFSRLFDYFFGTVLEFMLLMCQLLPFVLVIGIIGIVLGAKSRKTMRTRNGIGKAGLIISIIATAIIAVYFILLLSILIHTTLTWGT